jgi:hypothetical protein
VGEAKLVAVCAAALLVGGCGGGGGARPAPVPPPAPTPTPSPPPEDTAFPLSQTREFETIAATRTHRSTPALQPGVENVTPGAMTVSPRGPGLTIRYDAANQSYTVSRSGATVSFTASDRAAASDSGMDVYQRQSGTVTDELRLSGNVRTGGPSGAPVELTYLSYGMWLRRDSQTGDQRRDYLLFGFPTATGDMPRSGVASYRTTVSGNLLRINPGGSAVQGEIGGTATLSANFADGTVSTSLSIGRFITGESLGNYQGSAMISANQFSGSFTGGPYLVQGDFAGGFFGPGAREAGYAFRIERFNPDPYAGATINVVNDRIVGVVTGVRN